MYSETCARARNKFDELSRSIPADEVETDLLSGQGPKEVRELIGKGASRCAERGGQWGHMLLLDSMTLSMDVTMYRMYASDFHRPMALIRL